MQMITTSTGLLAAFRRLLRSYDKVRFAVAWASAGFGAYDSLVKASGKIERSVVGTHFYQTDPEFIKTFRRNENVRFVDDHSDVFHPKIYVFQKNAGGGWACLVGSPNFTKGGFSRNREAALLVTSEDDPQGSVFRQAIEAIDDYWAQAVPGKNINLINYEAARGRFKLHLAHAAGVFGGKAGRPIEEVDILNMNWDRYLRRVRADKLHATERRLLVLGTARALFEKNGRFEKIGAEDRKGIAGFRENNELDWGWFGSMRGAGEFKKIVNRTPGRFGDALDYIPLTGPVSKDRYIKFAGVFARAFPIRNGKASGHGLATGTRLLAMKRPDYFVCLDEANRKALLAAFGARISGHDYEGYWDNIVERVMLSPWWTCPRPPTGEAQQVWDGRVAMLDALFYSA